MFSSFQKQKIDPNIFLDKRNQNMWDDLSKNYKIDVFKVNDYSFSVKIINSIKCADIYTINTCLDGFTHELLHIYLVSKEYRITDVLISVFQEHEYFRIVFEPYNSELMGNIISHKIMYDIYMKMGYEKEKFITDYNTHKLTRSDIERIKKVFINNKIKVNDLDFYIGKLFSVFSDQNENISYSKELDILRGIDNELFDLVFDFFNKVTEVDLDELCYENVSIQVYDFYSELKAWGNKKVFCE